MEAIPYEWPMDGRLSPKTTALVIIDMQRDCTIRFAENMTGLFNSPVVCSPGGYLEQQGYNISATRTIIPKIRRLLDVCRENHYPVYHTREGHRHDLSTLSHRERLRSRMNPSGLGIGDHGPLGRLLVRGEAGHDTIPELYPIDDEPVIDKPGRSAFAHTDFELLLRVRGVCNLIMVGVTTDVCVSSTMREANDRGFDCVLVSDASAASDDDLHVASVESVRMEGGIFGATTEVQDVVNAIEAVATNSTR